MNLIVSNKRKKIVYLTKKAIMLVLFSTVVMPYAYSMYEQNINTIEANMNSLITTEEAIYVRDNYYKMLPEKIKLLTGGKYLIEDLMHDGFKKTITLKKRTHAAFLINELRVICIPKTPEWCKEIFVTSLRDLENSYFDQFRLEEPCIMFDEHAIKATSSYLSYRLDVPCMVQNNQIRDFCAFVQKQSKLFRQMFHENGFLKWVEFVADVNKGFKPFRYRSIVKWVQESLPLMGKLAQSWLTHVPRYRNALREKCVHHQDAVHVLDNIVAALVVASEFCVLGEIFTLKEPQDLGKVVSLGLQILHGINAAYPSVAVGTACGGPVGAVVGAGVGVVAGTAAVYSNRSMMSKLIQMKNILELTHIAATSLMRAFTLLSQLERAFFKSKEIEAEQKIERAHHERDELNECIRQLRSNIEQEKRRFDDTMSRKDATIASLSSSIARLSQN